jgi:hypothetical protein
MASVSLRSSDPTRNNHDALDSARRASALAALDAAIARGARDFDIDRAEARFFARVRGASPVATPTSRD